MNLKRTLIGMVAYILLASSTFANSFGVPERPLNISPSNEETLVSVTPILTASEFIIKNDVGVILEDTILTKSGWLVYQNTGVTLVGGSNLLGADRDNGETVFFDVSGSNLTLSGALVSYAYINHKRLELQGVSHNLLGYVELPSFIWQAENKDKYLAARFRQFDNSLIVEWNYGDDSAGTPWYLQLQAVLNEGVIGLKINQSHFSAGFVAAYGSEGVSLCDESACFNHTFSNIYNSGNAITCSLVSSSDSCENATLYSGVALDSMGVNEVAYGEAINTSYTLPTTLNFNSEYHWVTRQTGTLNAGAEFTSGWSNATSFSTVLPPNPVDNLNVEIIAPELIYSEQPFSITFRVTNNGDSALTDVGVVIVSSTLRDAMHIMDPACAGESNVLCTVDSLSAGESVEFVITTIQTLHQLAIEYSGVVENIIPPLLESVWNSNVPSPVPFETTLELLSANEANSDINFSLNISSLIQQNVARTNVWIAVPGELKTFDDSICSKMSSNGEFNLGCSIESFSSLETQNITFTSFIDNNLETSVLKSVKSQIWSFTTGDEPVISQFEVKGIEVVDPEVVDPEVVDPEVIDPEVVGPEVIDPEVVGPEVIDPEVVDPEVVDPEVVDPEVVEPKLTDANASEGGGSIWLIPLLGLILRRKVLD